MTDPQGTVTALESPQKIETGPQEEQPPIAGISLPPPSEQVMAEIPRTGAFQQKIMMEKTDTIGLLTAGRCHTVEPRRQGRGLREVKANLSEVMNGLLKVRSGLREAMTEVNGMREARELRTVDMTLRETIMLPHTRTQEPLGAERDAKMPPMTACLKGPQEGGMGTIDPQEIDPPGKDLREDGNDIIETERVTFYIIIKGQILLCIS